MRSTPTVLLLAAALVANAGCESSHYVLEPEPASDDESEHHDDDEHEDDEHEDSGDEHDDGDDGDDDDDDDDGDDDEEDDDEHDDDDDDDDEDGDGDTGESGGRASPQLGAERGRTHRVTGSAVPTPTNRNRHATRRDKATQR